MRPPNNQSLTRLAATLTARSRRHRRHPNARLTPTNALTSTPFTASCETVACRLRINLVKLPARPGVVLARSWIDKLPSPVFRRHVTRSTSRPRGRERARDARYQNASRKIKLTCTAVRFLTTRIHSARRAPAGLSFNVSDAVSVNRNGEPDMGRSDRLRLSR